MYASICVSKAYFEPNIFIYYVHIVALILIIKTSHHPKPPPKPQRTHEKSIYDKPRPIPPTTTTTGNASKSYIYLFSLYVRIILLFFNALTIPTQRRWRHQTKRPNTTTNAHANIYFFFILFNNLNEYARTTRRNAHFKPPNNPREPRKQRKRAFIYHSFLMLLN